MDKYESKLNHIRRLHRMKEIINIKIKKENEELYQMEQEKIQNERLT